MFSDDPVYFYCIIIIFFHAAFLGGSVAVRMVEGLVSALELTPVPVSVLFIKFARV
jgi:hypothetical protein